MTFETAFTILMSAFVLGTPLAMVGVLMAYTARQTRLRADLQAAPVRLTPVPDPAPARTTQVPQPAAA